MYNTYIILIIEEVRGHVMYINDTAQHGLQHRCGKYRNHFIKIFVKR